MPPAMGGAHRPDRDDPLSPLTRIPPVLPRGQGPTGSRRGSVGPDIRVLPGTALTKTGTIPGHSSGTRRAPGGGSVSQFPVLQSLRDGSGGRSHVSISRVFIKASVAVALTSVTFFTTSASDLLPPRLHRGTDSASAPTAASAPPQTNNDRYRDGMSSGKLRGLRCRSC